jgi:Icc-related predicted phosphoesterase
MKFLILTDLHGKKSAMDWINPLIKNEGIDCVLFLGDAVELPTAPEESIKMIGMIECKRILAIPGNIDSPDMIGMIDQVAENMHGKGKQVGDVYIAGFGGSNPTIFDTPCEFQEDAISEALEKVSKEGMVLMVHAPAYGINDQIPSGLSVGSKAILEICRKYHPKVVLSGHIHEAFGRQDIDGTIYVNPGPAKDGRAAIMTVDGGKIDVRLLGPTD